MTTPYIIAECGINWNGQIKVALQQCNAAKDAGADCIKFQLYDPIKLLGEDHPKISQILPSQLSFQQAMYLRDYIQVLKCDVLFSVFDLYRLDWINLMGLDTVKFGCRSWEDDILIEAAFKSKFIKTIYQSVPYSKDTDDRIEKRKYLTGLTGVKYHLFHCIPEYPTPLEKADAHLLEFNGVFEGYSDHTEGISNCVVAASRGAKYIEKHFTTSRALGGPDQVVSAEPNEFKTMVERVKG